MVQNYTYLEIFLDDLNKEVNLTEFEKYFTKPHQTIKRKLNELEMENIISAKKGERLLKYKLNLENPLTKEYLIISEKMRLIQFLENQLFKTLFEKLNPFFEKNTFIIFGSAVNSSGFSDIDLLILSNKEDKELKSSIKDFENTFSVKIHAIQNDKDNITKTLKVEIMKKHIILNKHDSVFRWIYGETQMVYK